MALKMHLASVSFSEKLGEIRPSWQGCLIEFWKQSNNLQKTPFFSAGCCCSRGVLGVTWGCLGAPTRPRWHFESEVSCDGAGWCPACWKSRSSAPDGAVKGLALKPLLQFGPVHSGFWVAFSPWTCCYSLSGLLPDLPHLPSWAVSSLPLISVCLPLSFSLKVTPHTSTEVLSLYFFLARFFSFLPHSLVCWKISSLDFSTHFPLLFLFLF